MEQNKYFLPISVIAAGLLIAGAVMWNGSRPPAAPGGEQVAVDIAKINMQGNPFIGSSSAPVTIAVWSDFQCPFCKQFEVGGVAALEQRGTPSAFPDIVRDYVETGKVKVVFLDLAFLGNDSIDAARYNHAVWKLYPEKYFEWRETVFRAQDGEAGGFGNAASIDKLNATIAGIDAAKVKADVDANKAAYDALIARDKAEAAKIGVRSTPSTVIGTQVISGAYDYATFKAAIDAQL